jgi:hypothetical protein
MSRVLLNSAQVRILGAVGVPKYAVCRSDRRATGLPRALRRAIERANRPKNASLACWLDQAVREDESLYVHVTKPTPEAAKSSAGGQLWTDTTVQSAGGTATSRSTPRPFCLPQRGDWLPCQAADVTYRGN